MTKIIKEIQDEIEHLDESIELTLYHIQEMQSLRNELIVQLAREKQK